MTGQVRDTLVYDIEVLRGPQEIRGGWDNPYGMGFGTAVVYSYGLDQYLFFGPEERFDLIKLLTGCRVISFNGIKFDNRVLLGNEYEHCREPQWIGEKTPWMNVDLLAEVVKAKFGLLDVDAALEKLSNYNKAVHDGSINLDGLAEGTLGMHKTGEGAHAPVLIKNGQWPQVYAYNLHDVRLTRMLYNHINKHGRVVDRKNNHISIVLNLEAPEG